MFGDMMEKLQKMQQQVGESKARLETITVEGKAEGITILMNGNRKVLDITFEPSMLEEAEDLQDLLVVAFNRALENADKVNESEMASSAKDILPNFPGLG